MGTKTLHPEQPSPRQTSHPWSTGSGDGFPWMSDAILEIFTTLRPAEPRHEVQR